MRKFKLIRQAVNEENNINLTYDQNDSEVNANSGLSLNFSQSLNQLNNEVEAAK